MAVGCFLPAPGSRRSHPFKGTFGHFAMGTSVALPYPCSCHNRLNWREGNYGLLRAIFVKGTGVSVSLDSSCSPILLCGGKPSSPHRHCDGSPSIRPSRQGV